MWMRIWNKRNFPGSINGTNIGKVCCYLVKLKVCISYALGTLLWVCTPGGFFPVSMGHTDKCDCTGNDAKSFNGRLNTLWCIHTRQQYVSDTSF